MGCGKSFVLLLLNNEFIYQAFCIFSLKFISCLVTYNVNTKSCLNETMIIFFPEGQYNHFHVMILFLMNVFDSE